MDSEGSVGGRNSLRVTSQRRGSCPNALSDSRAERAKQSDLSEQRRAPQQRRCAHDEPVGQAEGIEDLRRGWHERDDVSASSVRAQRAIA